MTAATRRARYAAEHRHWRDRLLRAWSLASPDALEAGGLWYPRAEDVVAALAHHHNVGRPTAAGVIAALSPQLRWRENIEAAHALLGGARRVRGYPNNIDKARRIANGAAPDLILGGDKVCAFWANLLGSRQAVTIDTWAQRVAIGRMADQPKSAKYARIARAYVAAAEMVGCPPREFQAIIWTATRGITEHERDQRAIERILA